MKLKICPELTAGEGQCRYYAKTVEIDSARSLNALAHELAHFHLHSKLRYRRYSGIDCARREFEAWALAFIRQPNLDVCDAIESLRSYRTECTDVQFKNGMDGFLKLVRKLRRNI